MIAFGMILQVLQSVAREVAAAVKRGVEVAIVVGGGNYFRGAAAWSSWGLERATADTIGMLATVMNAKMLENAIEKFGTEVRVQTAIEMREIAEPFIRRRAIRHLERGRVVIFGAGTGGHINPRVTVNCLPTLSRLSQGDFCYEVWTRKSMGPSSSCICKLLP